MGFLVDGKPVETLALQTPNHMPRLDCPSVSAETHRKVSFNYADHMYCMLPIASGPAAPCTFPF